MENKTNIENAITRFEKAGPKQCLGFLVPLECTIVEAEKELTVKYPVSYKEFLQLTDRTDIPARDIITENKKAYNNETFYHPEFLVAFFYDGMGNHYCFDTRSSDDKGEYPIVFWDHELSAEEQIKELKKTDSNFNQWFLRYADQLITEPDSSGTWILIGCITVLTLIVVLVGFGIAHLIKML